MTGDLLVRVTDASGVSVTVPAPADLRMSSSIPGGYDTLAATIPWPHGVTAPDVLTKAARVQVVDCRHGEVVWSGRMDDPGDSIEPGLAAYAVAASGEQSLMDGFRRAYSLVDRDPDHWVAVTTDGGESQQLTGAGAITQWPGDWAEPGPPRTRWEQNVSAGTAFPTGGSLFLDYVAALYHGSGQINQVTGTALATRPFDASWNLSKWAVQTFDDSFGQVSLASTTPPPASQDNWVIREGVAAWTTGMDVRGIRLHLRYTGAATDTTVAYTLQHANLIVYSPKYNRDGSVLASDAGPLYANQIVLDLLGRGLAQFVDADPILDLPTAAVEHASWWDGVSAREVLSFVAQYGPGRWWAVWGPRDGNPLGHPRFEYATWDGALRYHLMDAPGVRVDMAGGADSLANRALVIYQVTDKSLGHAEIEVQVPLLDEQGIVRSTTVDLTGRGPLTEAKAVELGRAALVELVATKPSGTVTVTGPVYDHVLGRSVEPWEIRPGSPVHVVVPTYQALPYPDSNADGRAVFRLTGVAYDHGRRAASLSLDGGSRTLVARVKVGAAPRRYTVVDPRLER